jgi:two-component system, NtrC family, response regulator HydG
LQKEAEMDKILIIEDDKVMNNLLTGWLRNNNFSVESSVNGTNGINKVKTFKPDILILDVDLPDLNGFEVLKRVSRIDQELVTIMITGFGNVKDAVTAMKMGALNYVSKPFNNEELLLIINRGLNNKKLQNRVHFLENKLSVKDDFLIGNCQATQKMLELVEIVAPTDVSVILSGRSGTGKELLARMIHDKSNRKHRSFLAVDCGAIPDTLRENELFGHDKEAFTGARSARKGKFEIAEGGTLFLDEIGNLPLSAQITLLRVLQEKQIVRIGDHKPINIDIRIITATNVNLEEQIKKGLFREDLFFRLNEFIIDIPTLTERKEDIPLLAKHFLDQANSTFNKKINSISPDAIKSMQNYNWPGNVRQLKNLIYRTVLVTGKDVLKVSDFEFPDLTDDDFEIEDLDLARMKRLLEIKMIKKALQKFRYNKSKTAAALGISRKSLYSKILDYNLD